MAGTAKTAAELNAEIDSLVASSQVPPIAALAMRQVLQDMVASSVGMTSSGVVASPHTVLAGPATGTASGDPSFRALVQADIPNFSVVGANIRNVTDFGVVLDGVTDNTVAVQLGIDTQAAAGAALFFPSGICMVSTLLIPAPGLSLVGSGPQSVIKQIAGTNADMISAIANSTNLNIESLTIDGNWQNQTNDATHTFQSLDFRCSSTASAPSSLTIRNAVFQNGRQYDIQVRVTDSTIPVYIDIHDSQFLGGIEGTDTFASGYVTTAGTVITSIANNLINFNAFGAVPSDSGRMGLQLTALGTSPTTFVNRSRQLVTGNTFRYVGRSTDVVALGIIGSIDMYTGNMDAVVSNNRVEQPYGRGINIKANEGSIAITGNVVAGLNALHGVLGESQISVLQSVSTEPGGKGVVIANNIVHDSVGHGITAIALTSPTLSNEVESNVVISGNTVINPVDRGIYLNAPNGAVVIGNSIYGGDPGIYAQNLRSTYPLQIVGNTILSSVTSAIQISGDAGNATGNVMISDNVIDTPGNYGIFMQYLQSATVDGNQIRNAVVHSPISIQNTSGQVSVKSNNLTGGIPISNGGSNSGLWVEGNYSDVAFTFTGLLATVTANAVTAWTGSVVIDNSTGNQIVNTINGVPDGAEVLVQSASNSNTVVLQTGGNLILPRGSMTFYSTAQRIKFKSIEGQLVELLRQSSTATPGLDSFAANQQNIASGTASTAFGQSNTASSAASFAAGFSNTTSGGGGAATFGQINTTSGFAGFTTGSRATDRGRYGARTHASHNINTGVTGDSQTSASVLQVQSGQNTTPVRLTADLAAAGAANIVNIPDNTAMAINVDIVAVDHTTPSNNEAWISWPMLLTRVAGTVAFLNDPATTKPTPITNGTVAGSDVAITADDTNKGINITFTPPTLNINRWDVSASVRTTEVQ